MTTSQESDGSNVVRASVALASLGAAAAVSAKSAPSRLPAINEKSAELLAPPAPPAPAPQPGGHSLTNAIRLVSETLAVGGGREGETASEGTPGALGVAEGKGSLRKGDEGDGARAIGEENRF